MTYIPDIARRIDAALDKAGEKDLCFFSCRCALLHVEKIRSFTSRYEDIVAYLENPDPPCKFRPVIRAMYEEAKRQRGNARHDLSVARVNLRSLDHFPHTDAGALDFVRKEKAYYLSAEKEYVDTLARMETAVLAARAVLFSCDTRNHTRINAKGIIGLVTTISPEKYSLLESYLIPLPLPGDTK